MRARVARSLCTCAAFCTPHSRSRATGSALWVSVESGDSLATALDSHHIAAHARAVPLIARDSRHRSPDARSFQPRRACSRARIACAALPPLGAATPTSPPSCHGRARRCRSRGSGCWQGGDRAVRSGGRAAIGASRTRLRT
eukprot:6819145-Prymnesium_polylepis.2